MGRDCPAFLSCPGEDFGIGRRGKLGVLNADEIHLRKDSEEATNDPTIEILIRGRSLPATGRGAEEHRQLDVRELGQGGAEVIDQRGHGGIVAP